MTELQFNKITAWQKSTFPNATPLSILAHLAKELEEVYSELHNSTPNKRLEFADAFILLFGCASSDGMTYQDICNAIQEKHEINKKRKWGKPDANGVIEHLKDNNDK